MKSITLQPKNIKVKPLQEEIKIELFEVEKPKFNQIIRLILWVLPLVLAASLLKPYLSLELIYIIPLILILVIASLYFEAKMIKNTHIIFNVEITNERIQSSQCAIAFKDIKEIIIKKEIRAHRNLFISQKQEVDKWEFEMLNGTIQYFYVRVCDKGGFPAIGILRRFNQEHKIKIWEYPIF